MSPEYARPYVKAQKNDARDAEAFAEAATRPTTRFVELKSPEQLDMQSLHRIRDRLVGERTALMNQLRRVDGAWYHRPARAPLARGFELRPRPSLLKALCGVINHGLAHQFSRGVCTPHEKALRSTVLHKSWLWSALAPDRQDPAAVMFNELWMDVGQK
jgi:hypothetical protein